MISVERMQATRRSFLRKTVVREAKSRGISFDDCCLALIGTALDGGNSCGLNGVQAEFVRLGFRGAR